MRSRVTTNARLYQIRYTERAKAFEGNLDAAMRKIAADTLKAARDLSSGPYKLDALRKMGHPYARRAPRAIGSEYPARINVQSGTFRRSWRAKVKKNKASTSVTIRNTDPKARRFLTGAGTKKMVGRPIFGAIAKRVERQARAELRKVPRKSIGPAVRPMGAAGSYPDLGGAFMRGFRQGQQLMTGL